MITIQQAGLHSLTVWVYAYVSSESRLVYLSVLYALVCACGAEVVIRKCGNVQMSAYRR